ncbi:MAG TPA: translocation/assembly module TamB domain-containing protein, partial [Chthoniobacteraceae bacterium]
MPDPEPTAKIKKPKRSWFRRLLRWVGVLLLLLAIFHRPLFHFTVRFALRMAAARSHVTLDLRTSGTIFTNLTVAGVHARPDGKGVTPIRAIDIERVRLDYSIPALIKEGIGEFLSSYEVHQATLEFEAQPSKTKEERKEKVEIAKLLNDILGQPAAYSDRVLINHFSIVVHAPESLTEVRDVELFLDPEKPGYFRIARLAAPGVPLWENLAATTSYVNRNLFIRELRLGPELAFQEINFDASRRAENKGSMTLKAQAFGGQAIISLAGEQLAKKGENLERGYATTLTVDISDVAIDRAAAYFRAPAPPAGKLANFSLLFTGEPEKPRTWNGHLNTRVETISAGAAKIDVVRVASEFSEGWANISAVDLAAGGNTVSLSSKIRLPETVNDFRKTDVDATLKIAAADLPALTGPSPQPITGAVNGGGTVSMRGGLLTAALDVNAEQIAGRDLNVEAGKLEVRLTKRLDPAPPSALHALDGTVSGEFSGLRFQTFKGGSVRLNVESLNDLIDLQASLDAAENQVALKTRVRLPQGEHAALLARSDVDADWQITAPNLPVLTGMLPDPISGSVNGSGKASMRAGVLTANGSVAAEKLANKDLGVAAGKIAFDVTRQIDPPPPSMFDGLAGKVSADLSALRFQTFTADLIRLDGETLNRAVKLSALELRSGENFITAAGTAELPRDPKNFAQMPVDAQFQIRVPQLGAFGVVVNRETLGGRLEGDGTLKMVEGGLAGGIKLDGADFTLGGFKAQRLAVKVDVANNEAVIDQFALQIDPANQIAITGKSGVAQPFAYEAGLAIDFKSLSALQPLLDALGQKKAIAGVFGAQWSGRGQVQPQAHSGELKVELSKAKFGDLDLREIRFAGLYTPEYAESQPFRFVTGKTSLEGVIEFRERKLRLRDLNLSQAGTQVLSGYALLPFSPGNAAERIPMNERLAVNISTTKLDIDQLLASFGQTSPAAGTITANLLAGGTLLNPFAHLKVVGERLQGKAAKQFDPAALTLDLHYSEKDLTLAATVKQPQIQPLTIKGRAPLDLEATIQNKKLDPNLPLEFVAQLPTSSLAFIPKVVPAVRRIDGTAGLDVRVGGTVGKPVFSGGAAVELKNARLVNENVPVVGAFRAKLAFAENTLNFQTFEGEVGGGTFKLGGNIGLANPKDPIFALRLQSDEVLVKRDDAITIRADTDVKLDGPLTAAAVSGTLYIVHSRFFKEIDILPIALPGKPKPVPKSAQTGPTTVSFPEAPLRDWKFDLAIKTREDDPFLIRGNLANGAATVNLRLGGTGLAPYLEGTVNIRQFLATLPFSKLAITSGFLAFTKDLPFQPTMELQAESTVRNYLVHAFIYGKATDPQVTLNSEPPLPHADIVSLLATGTTTAELGGSANALASRAAVLAIKQLYQKIVKSKTPPAQQNADTGSIMDRFDFEVGAVDNRTGGQEATARFELNKQIYLLGEVGVDGNFTGSLKYLIRFR